MDSIKISFYFSDEKEKNFFEFIVKQLKAVAKQEGFSIDDLKLCSLDELGVNNSKTNCPDCIVIPFCTKNMDTFVGLKKVRNYRTDNYKTPFLFIIYSKHCLPDFMNPHKVEAQFIKDLLGNPPFGNVNKAVLMAESFIDADNNELKNFVLLSLTDNNFFQSFVHKLKWIEKYNNDEVEKIRKRFYHTFVDYYDYNVGNSRKKITDLTIEDLSKLNDYPKPTSEIAKIKEGASNQLLKDVLGLADYIHCFLNGLPIPEKKGTHNTPLELFRAPVPFSLQELVDARDEITSELKREGSDKKIKLLLIDNRFDNKFMSKGDKDVPIPESLCNLLFSEDDGFGLGDIFEIQMLGKSVYKKKDEDNAPQFYQNDNDNELSNYSDFEGEYEKFKFNNFKNSKPLEESENKYHKAFIDKQNKSGIKNYADLVYHKIKDAHFVLLDFFLNTENTYLAFDFIRDIADIKKQEGNVSTTWYFITSAVYDSVVKYSQSGLLAEYYESAVVSAGDDPTNKKRQIIFVYKLLTFINARLKSFLAYKEDIEKRLISRCLGWNCSQYHHGCGKNKCLEEMLRKIKKYITELEGVHSIFYKEDSKQKIEDVINGLDNVIKNFLWLPEADWPMIQRQIEHINSRLEDIDDFKNRRFSCNYIREEIKKRSDIY